MDSNQPAPGHDSSLSGHRKAEKFDLVYAIRTFVRTSPWLTIAICFHVLVGAIFATMHFAEEHKKEDVSVIAANIGQHKDVEAPPPEEAPEVIDRTAIPENVEAELVSNEVAQIQLTDALADPNEDLHLERGDPNAVENLPPGSTGGTSIGVSGGGHRGSGIPSAFAGRKLGGGGPKGRAGGKTEGTEKAVKDGLVWLARHQESTGQWSAKTFMQHCPPGHACQPETAVQSGVYFDNRDVGLTGLALLCYLGAGFGHDAKEFVVDTVNAKRIYIGKDIVKPGLQWLVNKENDDGSFSLDGKFFLYNEAIATLALSEAYGLTQAKYWKEPAQRAINFICKAQRPFPGDPKRLGGWRYLPADAVRNDKDAGPDELSDADMSVTGWMVMALKSAEASGLEVPEATIKGALDFTTWCTTRKGEVGYAGPETVGLPLTGDGHENYLQHKGTMSSIAMCVRIFLQKNLNDPFLTDAADVLLLDLPAVGKDEKKPALDYYYWYYGSLALNQIDGPDAPRRTDKYWGPWNKAMQATLLDLQDKTPGACTAGGWMVPDRWSYGVGPIYTTAINILTLEVYYRYANAFGTKEASKPAKAPAAEPKAATADGAAPAPDHP